MNKIIYRGMSLVLSIALIQDMNSLASKPTVPLGTRTLKRGESFSFEVEANPTTGYAWRWTCTPAEHVDVVRINTANKEKYHGVAGRGGTEFFKIIGKKSGSVTCVFEYGRPWDTTSYDNDKKRTYDFIVS